MKKLKFFGASAMAMLLLTSCLDGGNNEQSGASIGVIDYEPTTFKTLAYIDDNTGIYSPKFEGLSTGECIVFAFTINYDAQENGSGGKYLTATVPEYIKLDKGMPISSVDTTNASIRKNEISTMDAVILSANQSGYAYTVKNYLFVGSTHPAAVNDQNNQYEIMYNPQQAPKEIDGKRVYDFFLRVIKLSDGKGNSPSNTTFNYVFPLGNQIKSLQARETAEGKDVLNVRLNYIKEFNKDTTAATWGTSKVFAFPIAKETEK